MPDQPPHDERRPGRLSGEESLELGAQLAELSRAGLRLPEGLRAAAEELPGGRLAQVLCEIAAKLEQGQSLDQVLDAQGPRLPADLRGLILAGVRSGHVADVLEEFVDLKRQRVELRRRVWATLAYPVLLLALLAGLFLFIELGVVRQIATIFEDFETELPALTNMFLWVSARAGWLLLGATGLVVGAVLVLVTLGRHRLVARAQYLTPFVGPLWRYSRLGQLARMVEILLLQGVSLPEALRIAGGALPDGLLLRACFRAADEVEGGRRLSESMASDRAFPPTMVPLVDWGERHSALPEAFGTIAETFEGRVQTQGSYLDAVVLPVAFLMVLGFVSTFILALMLPLVSLIQKLT